MANPAQSWQLRLAAALLTLEAVAALGWAAWLALEMVIATPQSVPLALALIVVLVGFGLWVLLAARGLRAGRAWARSAAVFVQLVMTALGVGSLGGSTSSVVICLAWCSQLSSKGCCCSPRLLSRPRATAAVATERLSRRGRAPVAAMQHGPWLARYTGPAR